MQILDHYLQQKKKQLDKIISLQKLQINKKKTITVKSSMKSPCNKRMYVF